MFFAFDLIGDMGFGKSFGQLSSGVEHPAIRPIHAHIKLLGIFQTVPWLLYLLSCIPGAASTYSEIFGFCAGEIRNKLKVCLPQAVGELRKQPRSAKEAEADHLFSTDPRQRQGINRYCVLAVQGVRDKGRHCRANSPGSRR